MNDWLKAFIEALKEVLKYPPYLIFVFISAVFVCLALITNHEFHQVWVFFLYAAIGSIWRYIEKDFQRQVKEKATLYYLITIIYHLGNLALIAGLLKKLH